MKKFIMFLIVILIPINISANEKKVVFLNKCVDGDTAWVNLNNNKIKLRFLAINTPESTNKKEPYGKEASNFTCNKLTAASKIEIEYDNESDKTDKYDRHLVWVFVDDELLQDLIIKEGLAQIQYVYGDYKYLDTLNKSLVEAKSKSINIWSNNSLFEFKVNKELLCIFVILLIIYIFNKKGRKKINTYIKKSIRKLIK